MAIDEPVGQRLRALAATVENGDWYTITLDVTPGREGALTVLHTMLPVALGAVDWTNDRVLRELLDAVTDAIDETIDAGDHGLLFVASDGQVALQTHTALPFRNTVHRGPHPWIFEYERIHALTHRPVLVAQVDRHGLEVLRVQHEHTIATDHAESDIGRVPSRTGQDGRTRAGQGYAGGHSRHRIERSVEAHRAQFAHEGADLVASTVGPDDLLILVGPPEARARLHHALSPTLQERVVAEHGIDPEAPRDARVHEAILAASAQHYAETDRLAAEILGASLGGRGVRGPEAAARAITAGRLQTLILHEDAVSHFGDATDVREHEPPEDEHLIDRLLHDALEQGAEVQFARLPDLLPVHAGVAGLMRW